MKKRKKDINCGTILSSHCVDYTGNDLKSLEKGVDQCGSSVTDVIELIDGELKKTKDSIDTKKISKLCIDTIEKEDNLVQVTNKLIEKICDQDEHIKTLEEKLANLDILSLIVSLDSGCLDSVGCSTDSTLKSFLVKLVSKLCLIEGQINNSGSSSFYQP